MHFQLQIWRQASPNQPGQFVTYELGEVTPNCSFLEMLDLLNEKLLQQGEDPVAFDHDCREGICGSCAMTINGIAQGAEKETTACQLYMRHFCDGDTITIEPWRAKPFPVIQDLVVDRSAFDALIQAGGFITARTGSAPEANETPIAKPVAEEAMDAAACIACGACVATCKNASAMLFVGAKTAHLNRLPQGQPEKDRRVLNIVETMDQLGFGNCSNFGECQAVCPKGITLDVIAQLNRDYAIAQVRRFWKGKN